MNAITKALSRSRAVYNTAHDFAMTKARSGQRIDFESLFTPMDVGIFQQLPGADQRKYADYRGWVYSAVHTLAMEAAGQPAMVGKLDKGATKRKPGGSKSHLLQKMTQTARHKATNTEVDILENHPLALALDDPNRFQGRWQFTYSFVVNLCLTGWGFIIGDRTEDGGYEFYSIPSTWVQPDHSDGAFNKFRIVNPKNPGTMVGEPLDSSMVAFAHLPNPSDPLGALSPVDAQRNAVRIDDSIQTSQENFFDNGIFPSVIVTVGSNPHPDVPSGVRPRLTAEQRRQVYGAIRKVNGGVMNYGNPAIIDGLIERIDRFSSTQEEMGWEKSELTVRGRILSAFGIHPFILGEQMVGSYSQAFIIEERLYRRINTLLDLLGNMMTRFVGEIDGEDDKLVWWEEKVPSDPQMELQKWSTARSRDDVNQNEFRAFMGLPPDQDEAPEKVPKAILSAVMGVAAQVTAGQLTVKQGQAILDGMGIPEDLVVDIAGEGPPEPPPGMPGMMPGEEGQQAQLPAPQEGGNPLEEAMAMLGKSIEALDVDSEDLENRIYNKSRVHVHSKSVGSLYVSRKVVNTDDIVEWAEDEGIDNLVDPDELHVTVAYSRDGIEWNNLKEDKKKLILNDGYRGVQILGTEGKTLCLMLESPKLQQRHQEIRDQGASWDWAEYMPHITISTEFEGDDISWIKPYDGPIILGPEKFEELKDEKSKSYLRTKAFCPTGEGGGVDNSCSPDESSSGSSPKEGASKAMEHLKSLASKVKFKNDRLEENETGVWGLDAGRDREYAFDVGGRRFEINVMGGELLFSQRTEGGFPQYGITGKGGAKEVFTNVLSASVALLKKDKPSELFFSAAEPSRRKLYDRIVRSVSAIVPEYSVVADSGGGKYFLVKGSTKDFLERLNKGDYKPMIEGSGKKSAGSNNWQVIESDFDPEWMEDSAWEEGDFEYQNQNQSKSKAFCPTGEGGGIDSSCSPSDSTASEGFSEHKWDKAKDAAKKLLAVANAFPSFAAEVAKEAGANERVAKMALIAATIGDFSIPGLPVGSAAIIGLASVRNPKASINAARSIIAKLREGSQQKMTDTKSLSKEEKTETMKEILDRFDGSDEWIIGYIVARDEGASHEESLDLADAYVEERENESQG